MAELTHNEYKDWLVEIKSKIRSAQIKASIAVNSELMLLYWDLGKQIIEKQETAKWGSGFINQLSKDLRAEFLDMGGFSAKNLRYCRAFYKFYSNIEIWQQLVAKLKNNGNSIKWQQPVAELTVESFNQNNIEQIALQFTQQVPWGHNIYIFTKSNTLEEALFYIQETIQNNWGRDVLALQIKSDLYNRQGKSVTNFKITLPEPQSELAEQTIKDPYVFDFLTLTKSYKEKDIENQLVQHITKFLLELGKGFAFIGQQYHLEIANNDYYLDLLFYHVTLKCYVVIELKNTKFTPEFAGKMNFYLSAVDTLMKKESDNPTIGILLCRDKNNIEAEFALRDINKPMGVSEFQFTEVIPDNLQSSLPTVEELENELKKED